MSWRDPKSSTATTAAHTPSAKRSRPDHSDPARSRPALVTDCSRALDQPPGTYTFGPLDGGEAKQVTDFKDSLMSAFAWSRDGKWLVYATRYDAETGLRQVTGDGDDPIASTESLRE